MERLVGNCGNGGRFLATRDVITNPGRRFPGCQTHCKSFTKYEAWSSEAQTVSLLALGQAVRYPW